jgi:hypothetical protein
MYGTHFGLALIWMTLKLSPGRGKRIEHAVLPYFEGGLLVGDGVLDLYR